jgi:hypothetical protein
MAAKVEAALWAALHSAYITGAALLAGLLTAASAAGAHSLEEYLAYAKANYLGYLIANVITPALRAVAAAKGTNSNG